MTVVETRSVTASDGEDVVVEVIRAMAAAKNVSCTALDFVLSDVIDTDSLARLFENSPEHTPNQVCLTVTLDGFHVTLQMTDSDQVNIEVSRPPQQAAITANGTTAVDTGGLGE